MQYIQCPVCKSESSSEIGHYQKYTLHWCTGCDLQWWHPLESLGSSFYEASNVIRDTFGPGDRLDWAQWQFFRYLPKKKGSLLDIGCGTGRFLYEIKKRKIALQTTGLDFDRNAIEVAKGSFGLDDVHAMPLEEFCDKNSERKFDIITSFHVLEHQCAFVDFLERVKKLLVPGGYVVLGIPNRNMWKNLSEWNPWWDSPPHHLTRWSARALHSFVERGGFSVVLVSEAPVSLSYARVLISSSLLRSIQDATIAGVKKMAEKTQKSKTPSSLKVSISTLRLLRRAVLFIPTLFVSTLGRASHKKGFELFCIAKKTG